MNPLWREINDSIHRRDVAAATRLIPKYLRAEGRSPHAIYEVSEFYRKLSLYPEALRVLPKEAELSDVKLGIQLARILNVLGASGYALRLAEKLRAGGKIKSRIELLEIYESSFRYEEVLELSEGLPPPPENDPWHRDWLLYFYRADALCGVGRTDEAIALAARIERGSDSRLIQAIAREARGEYLVRASKPGEALSHLLEAARFFPRDDATADHGILQKWLGICLTLLGKRERAAKALGRAFEILYRPGTRPEAWWEVLVWQDRLREGRPRERFAPRLVALEGAASPLLRRIGRVEAADFFTVGKILPKRSARHLDRASDLALDGKEVRLGLDAVDELACHLICAGRHGLPQFRAYELLWPDELFAFAQHQKRLEQLVLRARERGYSIAWRNLHLWLKTPGVSTDPLPARVIRGGVFLREHDRFNRRQVEEYFSISRSLAILLCRGWLEGGLIAAANASTYRVL